MQISRKYSQSGSALISIIIVVPFLILIAALYMELSVSSLNVARKDQSQTYAQFTSDAGIDYAMEKISLNAGWTGTAEDTGNVSGQIEVSDENDVRTTIEVTVTNNSATSKTLTSIGRTFRPSASTVPVTAKTIHADLRAVTIGSYSIVTGVGGLYMSNSAKIVGGDVLVNGEINMTNTSQIGLSTNPVTVEVAHQNCPVPADTNYPRLCAGGENGEPISISDSAWIYGSVKANNQTNGSSMSNPGLVSGSVTPGALPTHSRSDQISAVAQETTGAAASCSGSTPVTWLANTKINGDVTLSGSCQVTIEGNVWITGTLTLSNTSKLKVSDALTTTMPDLMVDGSKAELKNGATIVANSSGKGVRLLTYWSQATCSPGCTDVTGVDLYNSRNDETIILSNSASGPESIFYAKWTRVSLKNSGGVGALIGQTVNMSNNSTVTFGSSTAVSGTTYWVLDGYRRGN